MQQTPQTQWCEAVTLLQYLLTSLIGTPEKALHRVTHGAQQVAGRGCRLQHGYLQACHGGDVWEAAEDLVVLVPASSHPVLQSSLPAADRAAQGFQMAF